MKILKVILLVSCSFVFCQNTIALEQDVKSEKLPEFKLFRAEENYSQWQKLLQDTSPWLDKIKYLSLDEKSDIYMTIGGEFRPRGEFYNNRLWQAEEDKDFYSQRIALHSNIQFGQTWRLFTELYHGYTSHRKEFAEYDELDWHQAFVEYKSSMNDGRYWSLRAGRQELALGSARLVGFREGPNIRRSFDMIRAQQIADDYQVQLFYGKEVIPKFTAFDNGSSFFDGQGAKPTLWGLYSQFEIDALPGKNELYFLTFEVENATFNDVSGKEKRHTVGLRRFGRLGEGFSYNSEVMYQFGDLAGQDIKAFNIEVDWQYQLKKSAWQPAIGLKLEWSSGDNALNDQEINTFNPMFVNPAYYSVAKTITPANVVSIRPFVAFYPTDRINLYLEWASFKRESNADGLYRVTRFLSRQAPTGASKDMGEQLGFKASYKLNRNWTFDFDMSYFKAGVFLKQTGAAENIFYFSPTVRYKF